MLWRVSVGLGGYWRGWAGIGGPAYAQQTFTANGSSLLSPYRSSTTYISIMMRRKTTHVHRSSTRRRVYFRENASSDVSRPGKTKLRTADTNIQEAIGGAAPMPWTARRERVSRVTAMTSPHWRARARKHAHTHARTHARTRARAHARTALGDYIKVKIMAEIWF